MGVWYFIVAGDMAPASNPVPCRSDEREFDSSCNCFCCFFLLLFYFFSFFRAPGIRAFWWAPGGNIDLILHLVGGSRVANGIISGWDQVRLRSIRSWWDHVHEPVIVCLPAFSFGEFSQKMIIYQAENSPESLIVTLYP